MHTENEGVPGDGGIVSPVTCSPVDDSINERDQYDDIEAWDGHE